MQRTPQISIALCTYNGQDFLREQLESVLAQNFSDWELVAVDDCSTDNSFAILEEYASRDGRFRIFRNETNLGYNKNFEKALSLCEAELLAICDQDDIWHTEKLTKQMALISGKQLVYHDSAFIDRSGNEMNRRISEKFCFYRGSRPEPFLFLNCVSGHSILMKKSVFDISRPFPSDYHYDQWLTFNAANTGEIDFLKECLVKYRQHGHNNTDLLALHTTTKNVTQKVTELERESYWLLLCSQKTTGKRNQFITTLYNQSITRNSGYAHISFGVTIWKHRDVLLALLRKNEVSKFFYSLRKIWGSKAKTIA